MRTILSILIFFAGSFSHAMAAEVDSVLIRDLGHDLYFYDQHSETYLPLVSRGVYKGNTIHFDVQPNDFSATILKIQSDQEISLFINNRIFDIFKGVKFYNFDSVKRAIPDKLLHFTLYKKGINPFVISAEFINVTFSDAEFLAENAVVIKTRERNPLSNFAIVAFIVLVAFLAVLNNFYPRLLSDFFKISKAFALREGDENLFKSRPMNRSNLLFYLFLAFLSGLCLLLLVHQTGVYFKITILYPDGFWDAMWKWLQLSLFIFGWLLLKFILINYFSSLFRLGNFVVSHYYNYIRMTLFIFMLAFGVIILSYFGFNVQSAEYYRDVFHVILFTLGITVIVLFFKLLSTASYKSLHLFSYLCGTEIIPYVILLYFALNQSF